MMMKLYSRLQALKNDAGQDLLEYALLVALIALVAVGAVTLAGKNVKHDLRQRRDRSSAPRPARNADAQADSAGSTIEGRRPTPLLLFQEG